MDAYRKLTDSLHALGIESFLQNPELLVVSGQNPAMPDSNSFWVTKKGEEWFIGTWSPAVYKASSADGICDICEAVFRSSSTTIYSIERSLAEKFHLRRLTPSEMDEHGF